MTADSSKPEKAVEFDIEEYKGWLESMHRSEELGEKRLEFFLTFATAVLGAVVLLAKKKDDVIDLGLATTLAAFALPVLLMLGTLTFLRMLRRDLKTDEYKAKMKRIRARFGRDDEDDEKKHTPREMIHGGLTPVMIAFNALLLGLWVGILWRAVLVGAIGFALAWFGGVWWKNRSARKSRA